MSARTVVRGVGQTMITAGVVILLFVAYELWFTGFYTQRAQHDLRNSLEQVWAGQTPTHEKPSTDIPQLALGEGLAIVRIPRLGRDYAYVIVEGVSTADLKKGPGHYPGTALPGQLGNFVVSGHRTTYLAPFNRLDELRPGDPIVIETRNTWYTYRVTKQEVVAPTAIEVTYPVPGDAGAKPTERLLTFTTCNPKYSARQRLVVVGELASSQPKAQGPPPALQAAGG